MADQECQCPWPHPPGEDEFRPVVSIVAPNVAVSGQPMKADTVPPRAWELRDVRLVIDVTDDGSPFTRPDSPLRRVWLPTPDDGLYVHDLIGSEVVDTHGTVLGTCTSVLANPAHDILELDSGALVPVIFVTGIIDGVVTIDPPDGLFDLDE